MPRRVTSFFELLLVGVIVISLGLGVNWGGVVTNEPAVIQAAPPEPVPTETAQATIQPQAEATRAPVGATHTPAPTKAAVPVVTSTVRAGVSLPLSGTIGPIPTSSVMSAKVQIGPGDAPLLVQAPGTINILLLGVDSSADERYSRTDTILVASVNPDIPSVSLLSIPRDTQVRIPDHTDDRINTAYELGYLRNYPGGGPAFLSAVLRKNFGIRIDHYVRIDFDGFIKAVDLLGGIEVLAECELHDTFPDRTNFKRTIDLDVYPGRMILDGQQALMYSRSRYSTSDFDRARRQQIVIRALLSKVKKSNLLQNALGLYNEVRPYVDTDLGLDAVPAFINILERMNNLSIKSRVITYPVVKSFTRNDGAMVLLPTDQILPYIAAALSPPAGNRAEGHTTVELVDATGRKDMGAVAAQRLNWEGFTVVSNVVSTTKQAHTQIIDMKVSPKGSPIPRLAGIFNVARRYIVSEPDPSGTAAARIILGADYNSCPSTFTIAGDVPLASNSQMIPTSTPAK